MAHPWVADEGEGFQIWRVAENILIICRRQPTRGSSPAWRLGRGGGYNSSS